MGEHTQTVTRRLYTLEEARELLRLGRTKFYWLAKNGEIDVVEIGDRRMIESDVLEAFIASHRRSARQAREAVSSG